ncbi:sensor histidine kinase [Streptomyces poriferorum]|uniref:Sensor histidine kinase n=1 Tax=Streptomyces poriferorum TaxID=2798799 RepID=A0ABY9INW3_9ACTN|nr:MULTISPECIES: sensor histidine kinase [Streptomyces]MBW5249287.1 sensor histidine kinase [Streptomyces poriferorum]MBW5259820.1 sensor histidine kinase [Streptomyces poriferorum]MDP5314834.1 sensor histidine kinase [Streptomyces sp. Alt4]WLQ51060.1 sensor histidine kinase [Streptomyces sp. Alt1]WLQ56276.1 sensor histidine kinase [Streptomyces sp. Alt2]
MKTGETTAEQWWERFFRHGPYALLGLAAGVSAVTSGLIMSRTDVYAVAVLFPAALALQLLWSRFPAEQGSPAAQCHFVVRTLLALGLTWCNPFFSIYAVLGYFDSGRLLPERRVRAGLLATAVIMAGAQSGSGLPPATFMNWVVFGIVLAVHVSLTMVFAQIGNREAEQARTRTDTITALESANARLEQALAENAGLHAQLLVQAREAGVADERSRLAAEIHDTIAQGLTGIIAQLQAVTSTAGTDPALAGEHLARAAALARHSLGEARRSVHNLVPSALEHDDLPGALKKTVATWSERTGVRAEFTVTGAAEPLHDEVGATLLRIAEEALANAARHAGASRAGITLSYMGDEISLDVRDDGRGFDPAALPPYRGAGGFGLGGMRARAERIAGTVEVETGPGLGTAVCARVPMVRRAQGTSAQYGGPLWTGNPHASSR